MEMNLPFLADMTVLAAGNTWTMTLIITFLSVLVAEYMLPEVKVDGLTTGLLVAIGLALLNATLVPILNFFTAPFTWLTLGLFQFVVSAAAILIIENFVKGFRVNGWINAFIMAIVLSIASSVIGWIL